MFGRNVGYGRGDDHVTRAFDAIAAVESTATDTRSGGLSENPASGAGGSGREPGHGQAAGPTLKTADVDRRRAIRGGGVRQETYAAQSFIRLRRRSKRSLRR